ncbi:MAG: hypothetical protein ACYDCK_03040 [Thermoplasmatota archaeon]
MDSAALAVWALVFGDALAFFAPFAILRLRPVKLRPIATVVLAVAAAVVMLYAVEKAAALPSGAPLALLVALGLLPLGVAAGARRGWRIVAPVGGVLGLVVLALMAWGPLHPTIYPAPQITPPSPPLPLRAWAMLLAGTLALLVPWRSASALATAFLWLALVVAGVHDAETSELFRAYYMAGPAFFALAALLSAAVPLRERGAPSAPGTFPSS